MKHLIMLKSKKQEKEDGFRPELTDDLSIPVFRGISPAEKEAGERSQWTAITEVDTKKKPGRRITRHYAALLRISNGVRPYFISIRS